MHVICHAFNIDVLKMEQAFHMGYWEGDKVFYVFPLNQKGKQEFLNQHMSCLGMTIGS